MVQDIYEDSLYGQVLPSEDEHAMFRLILLVDGEEEFIIENDETGELLLGYVERWVTAEGVITEDDDVLHIKVRNYTLEDEMDYEDEDDW